jgi:ABC-type transporter Mla subunit MlaD
VSPATHQGPPVRSGLLIIGALLLGAFGIFFLDRLLALGEQNYTVVVVFADVEGLRTDAPVWLAGHGVGTVREVILLPLSDDTLAAVAVTIELQRRVQEQIRRDSEVTLGRLNLLADPAVSILPGTLGAPRLEPGDTLRATSPLAAGELVARATALRAEFDVLLSTVQRGLERGVRPEVRANLEASSRAAWAEFAAFQAQLEAGPVGSMRSDTALAGALTRVQLALDQVSTGVRLRAAEFGSARDSLAVLGPAFRETAARVAGLNAAVGELRQLLQEGEGFVGRMAQDTAIARALNGVQAQIDSLIRESKRNPLRYFF